MEKAERDKLIAALSAIPDPEIPVITISDLGVLRDVKFTKEGVEVIITPTYSGCPAMKQIADDIASLLKQAGIAQYKVNMVYDPPWTTDWLSDAAKEKLRVYGIAPPEHSSVDKRTLIGKDKIIACPRCGSEKTKMISQFGSTACKALFQCSDCHEPFDHFKCL